MTSDLFNVSQPAAESSKASRQLLEDKKNLESGQGRDDAFAGLVEQNKAQETSNAEAALQAAAARLTSDTANPLAGASVFAQSAASEIAAAEQRQAQQGIADKLAAALNQIPQNSNVAAGQNATLDTSAVLSALQALGQNPQDENALNTLAKIFLPEQGAQSGKDPSGLIQALQMVLDGKSPLSQDVQSLLPAGFSAERLTKLTEFLQSLNGQQAAANAAGLAQNANNQSETNPSGAQLADQAANAANADNGKGRLKSFSELNQLLSQAQNSNSQPSAQAVLDALASAPGGAQAAAAANAAGQVQQGSADLPSLLAQQIAAHQNSNNQRSDALRDARLKGASTANGANGESAVKALGSVMSQHNLNLQLSTAGASGQTAAQLPSGMNSGALQAGTALELQALISQENQAATDRSWKAAPQLQSSSEVVAPLGLTKGVPFQASMREAASIMPQNAPQHTQNMPAAEQVSLQLQRAANTGEQQMRIKLKPAELGHVDVELNVGHDGRVKAVIQAEKVETLHLLQRDADSLHKALADAGLKSDQQSLTFDLGSQQDNQGQQHAANANMEFGNYGDAGAADEDGLADASLVAAAEMNSYNNGSYDGQGPLDIRV